MLYSCGKTLHMTIYINISSWTSFGHHLFIIDQCSYLQILFTFYQARMPLCGEDGKVYDNKCLMECAGVKMDPEACGPRISNHLWRKTSFSNNIIEPNSIKLSVNDYGAID